ncbi:MAG: HlyD family secretion protein [Bdellovibrionota bacterium]
MKNKKNLIGIVLTAVVISVIYFVYEHFTYVSTDDAFVQAHVLMVSPRVSGTVQKVMVQENQKVKAGELLAQIDDRDYTAALAQAEADIASLEARSREAAANWVRAQELFKKHAITHQQFDDAQAAATESSSRLKAARARHDTAALNIAYTRITAPSNGSIAKKSVEVGQYITIGQPILGFVSSEERWVTANFKETELDRIHLGRAAHIDVDAIAGRDFEGEVESISSSTGATFSLLPPDNATGNFTKVVQRVPVRIKLSGLSAEDMDHLRAGLSANVHVRIR